VDHITPRRSVNIGLFYEFICHFFDRTDFLAVELEEFDTLEFVAALYSFPNPYPHFEPPLQRRDALANRIAPN
jgi:hypothetical protein